MHIKEALKKLGKKFKTFFSYHFKLLEHWIVSNWNQFNLSFTLLLLRGQREIYHFQGGEGVTKTYETLRKEVKEAKQKLHFFSTIQRLAMEVEHSGYPANDLLSLLLTRKTGGTP